MRQLSKRIKSVFDSIDSMSTLSMYKQKYQSIKSVKDKLIFKEIDGILIVDCRDKVGNEATLKSDKGVTLFSSEKADYVLGFGEKDRYSTIMSVSGTGDLRRLTNVKKSLKDAIKSFKEADKRFIEAAKSNPSLNGGGVTYKPAYIAICNYGYSIHGFSNMFVIT